MFKKIAGEAQRLLPGPYTHKRTIHCGRAKLYNKWAVLKDSPISFTEKVAAVLLFSAHCAEKFGQNFFANPLRAINKRGWPNRIPPAIKIGRAHV